MEVLCSFSRLSFLDFIEEVSLNDLNLPQTNRMGRFYTSEGMSRQHLQVMYVCVCGVMGVGVMGV